MSPDAVKLVPVAAPILGVTSVGVSAKTSAPDPVSSVTAVRKLALDGVARNVATPVPKPETPVEMGKPVQLVSVPLDGVPRTGVVRVGDESVGDVPKTSAPDPVSSVTADARLALEGVARNVATPVPRPETPVEIGRPVQLVNVPDDGVPRTGVTKVGDVDKTTLPDPVEDVTPVPPLATGSVPETCVVRPIFPHDGAVPTPPEIKALPVATSASLESVVVPLA